jgi:hypothetical protein
VLATDEESDGGTEEKLLVVRELERDRSDLMEFVDEVGVLPLVYDEAWLLWVLPFTNVDVVLLLLYVFPFIVLPVKSMGVGNWLPRGPCVIETICD